MRSSRRKAEAGAVRVWWSRLASLHNLFPQLVPPNVLVVVEVDGEAPSLMSDHATGTDTPVGSLTFDVKRYQRICRIVG